MSRREVDPAAQERPAAEMVDERVAGDHGPIARLDRPQAVVVVLEAADAEPLVQQADRVDHLAADQQAEPDQAVDLDASWPSWALPQSQANPSSSARLS